MKILIIEDEEVLRQHINNFFEAKGHLCEEAKDFSMAEEKILMFEYDLVILDLTLPDGNGLDLIEAIKSKNQSTGILILSAKNALDDKIAGLDLGADDYLTKPFHIAELNSRINALLRRNKFDGNKTIEFNEIKIDPDTREAYVNDLKISFTKKEFDLLVYLIVNKNRVMTKEMIAESLWGDDAEMFDNFDFVYTHIKNLRQKLDNHKCGPYLKSIYGVGYKFTDS